MSAAEAEAIQERKEECRRETRRYLAERPGLAFHPRVIARRISVGGGNFSEEETKAALEFLRGDGQAEREQDPLGSSPYFKITTKGTLAHERNA